MSPRERDGDRRRGIGARDVPPRRPERAPNTPSEREKVDVDVDAEAEPVLAAAPPPSAQVRVPAAPPSRPEAVFVRAVTGADERQALRTPGVQRALTVLLAQCVHTEGADHPIGIEAARALSSGERTRLAVYLGAVSGGGVLTRFQPCPEPDCRADVALRVTPETLVERPPPPESGTVRCPIPADLAQRMRGFATFRLPDGADQEAMEASTTDSRSRGLYGDPVLVRLLDRLLLRVSKESLPIETALWTEEDRQSAWHAIRAALGGPETDVDVTCPLCGARFIHRLTPLGWLRDDPKRADSRLTADVLLLRKHFDWTEEEVLWLPRPKRERYVEMLRRG